MTSSGLQFEVCVVHFKWIKGERWWIQNKFVKGYEGFVGCARLKIIFKSRKNKITKLCLILNMIKYYHYISLICCRKNINMYK